MARIGLQTWGSEGDVQPFLALAHILAERGHEVTLALATQSDKHYDAPRGVHLERVDVGMTGAEGDALLARVRATRSPIQQAKLIVKEALEPAEGMIFDAALRMAKRCDLVVRHHFLHPVQVASALEKTPELSVFFTPDLIPTAQRPPTGFPALGSFVNRALWRVAGWGINTVFAGSAQALRRAKGLAPSKGTLTDTWIGSRGVLVAVSPALWSRPEDWPQTVHLTGFWRGPASEAPMAPNVEQFLSSGPPPLYASFGSHFPAEKQARDDTAQLLIEAARRSGHRLILQQPDERESGARSGHEADVLQVPYSPHALVFPRCAAVIHHGGAGTTQTALQAGVPAIIVPHLADQFFWASHLEQLSVAVAAPARREVRPDTLASSIQRAVGVPDIAVHARKLGAILRQEDGLTAACEAIELALRPCP